jgi:hypothetical protein
MCFPSFLQKLRRRFSCTGHIPQPKKLAPRLSVECLEERTTPTILFNPPFVQSTSPALPGPRRDFPGPDDMLAPAVARIWEVRRTSEGVLP